MRKKIPIQRPTPSNKKVTLFGKCFWFLVHASPIANSKRCLPEVLRNIAESRWPGVHLVDGFDARLKH